ncbi:MAG TPA: single-stranded-DNA-specific exonuclease RecJ [Ktedonobacterales bacterium]
MQREGQSSVGETHPRTDVAPGAGISLLDPRDLFAPLARPWRLADQLPLAALDGVPGHTRLQVQLLHNRGIDGTDAISQRMERDWHATSRLPGIDAAVERIRRALGAHECIVVFGDFDADGITSCALLVLALRALGADVSPYIPTRENAGRGPSAEALRRLAGDGATLVITTDCGTTNAEELAVAHALGMDVIITDHHAPEGPLAQDCILVNPHLADNATPDADLAGVGVALRLAEALLLESHPARLESLLDLVALGTIADMAPLSATNWTLVRAGLRQLNSAPRPGVHALLRQIGLTPGALHEGDIAYRIAPRLNAGQRMGEPRLALDLLLTEDLAQAEQLSARLNTLNAERQRLTENLVGQARRQWSAHVDQDAPVVTVQGDGWPFGLLGLAAGRLADEFHRPAVVVSREGDVCRGSLRGNEEASVVAALGASSGLLTHFGGHERAAGFTVSAANLDVLLASLRVSLVSQVDHPSARADLTMDCQLPLNRVTREKYDEIRALGPFGEGFAEPRFLASRVRLIRCFATGAQRRHLRIVLRDGTGQRVASWMGKGAYADTLSQALRTLPVLDVVYRFDPFYVSGQIEYLSIVAMRPSTP